MAEWISVKDRIPESGKHVLACCEVRLLSGGKKRYVCEAMYAAKKSISVSGWDDIDAEYDEETDEYYFPEGWWEYIHNWDEYTSVAIADFVTHWMPLPEPPKEVKKMADLIDRQALIAKCGDWYVEDGPEDGFIGTLKTLLDMAPAVAAVPVRRGRWINDPDRHHRNCSECKFTERIISRFYHFCPNCGAKMEVGEG